MKRRWMFIGMWCAASVLPTMAAPPAAQPDQVDFKFKFEPGRTTRQKLISKTVGDIKILGPMKFQQTFEQTLLTRCRKVNPDGSAVLDVTLSDVAMHQSMGPIVLDFDSRTWKPGQSGNPGVEFMGKLFTSMAGTTFTLTVDANGEPLKVDGLSETMKKALDQLGDHKEAQVLRKVFGEMIDALGDDNMIQQFRSFGRAAPPKQGLVKVGDKWNHIWSMKKFPMMAGGLEGKGDYELLGIETFNDRPCVKVRVKETFKMLPSDPAAPKSTDGGSALDSFLGRVKMEISSSGGDGIAYIDYQTGDIVKLRQTQNVELKVSAAADPNDADEETRDGLQPMTMKFRVSVSFDLLENDAAETRPAPEPVQPDESR